MQRRLVEELKELEDNIQVIKNFILHTGPTSKEDDLIQREAYSRIYVKLHELLSVPDKSFEVNFRGIDYNFIYPSTVEESKEMENLRGELINEIMTYCFREM